MNPIKLSRKKAIYIFIFSAAAVFYSQILIWRHLSTGGAINYFDASYYVELADRYFASGEPDKMQEQLQKALRLDPINPLVHYRLARYYASCPEPFKLQQAHEEYAKAMRYSEIGFQRSILEEVYQKYNGDYMLLRSIVPLTADSKYMFADFLRDKKRYIESLREFKNALMLIADSDDRRARRIKADSLHWIGYIYKWRKNHDAALRYFRAALKIDRQNPWFYESLGEAYVDVSDLEKAKAAFEKAIRVDPKRSSAYVALGLVYERMGLRRSAADKFKKALIFKPDEYTKRRAEEGLKRLNIDSGYGGAMN